MLLVSIFSVLLVLELQGRKPNPACYRVQTSIFNFIFCRTGRTSFSVGLLDFVKTLHHHSHSTYQNPSQVTGGVQLHLICTIFTSISKQHFKAYILPQPDATQCSLVKNRLVDRQASTVCRLSDISKWEL